LAEEWREVVLAQQVTSAAGYLAAKRVGRGRGLGSQQRAQVWQGIWEFQNHLAERRLWTYETVCVEATRLLAEASNKPYRHVVVDEAQDLSAVQWRLLRAAVAPADDDLFIAGDTHQRIYNNRVSLRDLGINVTGRSGRLTVNYRTTAEILGWSVQMLHGEQVDDMNDGLDTMAGCRSQVHGLPPRLRGFPTRAGELSAAAAQMRDWLDAGVRPAEIGIAARTTWLAKAAVSAVQAASIPVRLLGASENTDDAVSVATMHRMKGLEFRCLAVIGAGADLIPLPGAITPAEEDEPTHRRNLQRERCLLFVACTRAREQLVVFWHGQPCPFLFPVP
jgi:superfamily I DNA/RNA helicase